MDWLSQDSHFLESFFVRWYEIDDLVCIENCDLGQYSDPEGQLKTWAVRSADVLPNAFSEFNVTDYSVDN